MTYFGVSTLDLGHWTLKLKVQLQSELELPRIKRCGRPAIVTTVICSLVESAHVIDEWRGRSFVEPIEQIEPFGNYFKPDPLAQWHQPREAQINGHVTMGDAKVASKAATGENTISY